MTLYKKHAKKITAFLLSLLTLMGAVPLSWVMPLAAHAAEVKDSLGNDAATTQNETYQTEIDGWTVNAVWATGSDVGGYDYNWNAESDTTREVGIYVTYRMDGGAPRDYGVGEIKFDIPSFGYAKRNGSYPAVFNTSSDSDWNYKYNIGTDSYIVTNKKPFLRSNHVNGRFTLFWRMNAREVENGYTQSDSITFSTTDNEITLPPLNFEFTSKRDEYYIGIRDRNVLADEYNALSDEKIWKIYGPTFAKTTYARTAQKSKCYGYISFTDVPEGLNIPEDLTSDVIELWDVTAGNNPFSATNTRITYNRKLEVRNLRWDSENNRYEFLVFWNDSKANPEKVNNRSFLIGLKKDLFENKRVNLEFDLQVMYDDEDEFVEPGTCKPSERYAVNEDITFQSYDFPPPKGNVYAAKRMDDYAADASDPTEKRYNVANLYSGKEVEWYTLGGLSLNYSVSSPVGTNGASVSNNTSTARTAAKKVSEPVGANGFTGDMIVGDNLMSIVSSDGSMRVLENDEYHFTELLLNLFQYPDASDGTKIGHQYEVYIAGDRNTRFDDYVLYETGTLEKDVKVEFEPEKVNDLIGTEQVKAYYVKTLDWNKSYQHAIRPKVAYHLNPSRSVDPEGYLTNYAFMKFYQHKSDGSTVDITGNGRYNYSGTFASNTVLPFDMNVFGKKVYRVTDELYLRRDITLLDSETGITEFYGGPKSGYSGYVTSGGEIKSDAKRDITRFSLITAIPSCLSVDLDNPRIIIEGNNGDYSHSFEETIDREFVSLRKFQRGDKTYIVADFDFSTKPIDSKVGYYVILKYPFVLSNVDFLEHGTSYTAETFFMEQDVSPVVTTYGTGVSFGSGTTTRDVVDWDNDGNISENGSYSTYTRTVEGTALEAMEYTSKKVKTYYSDNYTTNTVTRRYIPSQTDKREMSEYDYRIEFGVGADNAKNIIMYDNIENGAVVKEDEALVNVTSEWKGTFLGVDTSYIERIGMIPTVYYSTVSDVPHTLGNGMWSTTPPADLSSVKSVAIHIDTSGLDGGALSAGQVAYVKINMLAPESEQYVGKRAVNQFSVTYDAYGLNGEFSSTYDLDSPETYVTLRNEVGRKTLKKVDLDSAVTAGDKTTYNTLANVEFNLYNSDRELITANPLKTNSDGLIVLKDYEQGTYYWEEVEAPTGYETLTGLHSFVIDSDENTIEFIGNTRKKGDVTLTKEDKTDESFDGSVKPVKGAVYALYKSGSDDEVMTDSENIYSDTSSAVKNRFTTNDEGKLRITGLPWGDYYFKEITAPTGYILSEQTVPLSVNKDSIVVTVKHENNQVKSTSKLTKYDDNSGNYLEGAKYVLERYKAATSDWIVIDGEKTTNNNGEIIINDLSMGHYRWRETEAPTGYTICEPVEFDITAETAGTEFEFEQRDPRILGKAQIQKTKENGEPLKGAVFSLYLKNGTLIRDNLVTDDNGLTSVVENLDFNKYYFRETSVPRGYVLDETLHRFEITPENSKTTQVVNVVNRKQLGSVKIVKTNSYSNAEDKRFLENAVFNLYRTDETNSGRLYRENITTDANGEAEVNGLEWGSYYLEEVSAPSGYETDAELRFSVNSQNCTSQQILNCENKIKDCELIIEKMINEQYQPFGSATFMFEITGTDIEQNAHKYTVPLTIEEGSTTGSVTLNIPAGSYQVIESNVSRYKSTSLVPKVNASTRYIPALSANGFECNLIDKDKSHVMFINKITQYEKLSHNDFVVNHLDAEKRLTKLTVEYLNDDIIVGAPGDSYTFSDSDIRATAYYNDGTSAEVNFDSLTLTPPAIASETTELDTFHTINVSYTEGDETKTDSFNVLMQTGNVVEEGVFGDNVRYKLFDNGRLVIYGTGPMYDYTRSASNRSPFYNRNDIKDVVVKNGVTRIGNWALSGTMSHNSSLSTIETVKLPESLESIGDNAFRSDTHLRSINLPNNLSDIGNYAFYHTAIETITIPENTSDIGSRVFEGCKSLKSFELLTEDVELGGGMFTGCESLETADLPENLNFGSYMFQNCSSLKKLVIPEGATLDTINIFDGAYHAQIYDNSSGAFRNYKSQQYLAHFSTYNLNDGSFVIKKGDDKDRGHMDTNVYYVVTAENKLILYSEGDPSTVGDWYGGDEDITEVEIRDGIQTIEYQAFAECTSLTKVSIPDSVTSIEEYAFAASGLTEITIPGTVSSLENGIFEECESLETVTFEEGIEAIPTGTFAECSALTTVNLPNTLTTIGATAFYNCSSLERIVIPASVESIQTNGQGQSPFYGTDCEIDCSQCPYAESFCMSHSFSQIRPHVFVSTE